MASAATEMTITLSGGQTHAPLGTAAFDDQTAAWRAHARTKAVGALAFQDTGLKGSFHNSIRSLEKDKNAAPPIWRAAPNKAA